MRSHDVAITQSKFKPPMHLGLETLLKEFFDWYNKEKNKLHSVELASLVHLRFVTIHPLFIQWFFRRYLAEYKKYHK